MTPQLVMEWSVAGILAAIMTGMILIVCALAQALWNEWRGE